MLAQSWVVEAWVNSWRRRWASRVLGSSPVRKPRYKTLVMITDPANDSGNCDATTRGMPSSCNAWAMLAPAETTWPTLPPSQEAMVTMVGLAKQGLPSRLGG